MKSFHKSFSRLNTKPNVETTDSDGVKNCQWCGFDLDNESSIHSLSPYRYKSLVAFPSTRVFRFSATKDKTEPIRGHLTELSFDVRENERPRYKALSYTWCSDRRPHTIECDGHQLSITCSLNSALRRLRSLEEGEIVIFAGCISINQAIDGEALSERASQVKLMHRIFKLANQVIADLGDDAKHSQDVLGLFHALSNIGESTWEIIEADIERVRDFGIPDLRENIWGACAAFLKRRWFSRLWIIQELVLAEDITFLVGHRYCSERLILTGVSRAVHVAKFMYLLSPTYSPKGIYRVYRANDPTDLSRQRCESLVELRQRSRAERLSMSTGELLVNTRFFQTHDSRDRIYAVMGLMDPTHVADFHVDYQETKASFQKRLSRFLVDRGDIEIMLTLLAPGQASTASSWMVDSDMLEMLDNNTSVYYGGTAPTRRFQADGGCEYFPMWNEEDDNILPIKGSRIAKVDMLSDECPKFVLTQWRNRLMRMVSK